MTLRHRISLGLLGATDTTTVVAVAERLEQAGLRGLWLNDEPGSDSLVGLAAAGRATQRLRLGTGVIPLQRRPASGILDDIDAHRLPLDRFTLGVGIGPGRGALERMRQSLAELRAGTAAELMVGSLGPRMRELGAQHADGLLLSWLTPEGAAEAAVQLREQAAGRPVRAAIYIRTIVRPEARERLEKESANYETYPQYAANFARYGISAIDSTIDGSTEGALAAAAAGYLDSVDELVIRAITPGNTLPELLDFVDRLDAAL